MERTCFLKKVALIRRIGRGMQWVSIICTHTLSIVVIIIVYFVGWLTGGREKIYDWLKD